MDGRKLSARLFGLGGVLAVQKSLIRLHDTVKCYSYAQSAPCACFSVMPQARGGFTVLPAEERRDGQQKAVPRSAVESVTAAAKGG